MGNHIWPVELPWLYWSTISHVDFLHTSVYEIQIRSNDMTRLGQNLYGLLANLRHQIGDSRIQAQWWLSGIDESLLHGTAQHIRTFADIPYWPTVIRSTG